MNWTVEDVVKWCDDEGQLLEKCTALCKDLTSGTEDIANLMIKLGPILTHSEVERRRKAVQFVTQIVVLLPTDLLLESQPSHILTFFHARLQDHHSLIPHLLPGINSLCMMKNAAEEDVLRVLFTILSGTVIMCQSQQREERSRIFDLIIYCSTTYYDTLVKRSSDYIQGVINAIEGERDPRNLLKLFEFMPSFLEKYPLEQWADEMFEVFACYYPIDFHPSPNDPNAITRDALAGKLERCLLGCKDFIEPALVLALEKLDTQLKVAKLDSLALLRSCAQKYGCNEIEAKFDNIWMTVKQELLPGLNDDVVRASLDTTRVIVQESREDQIRENILTVAFNSIAISLCDINLRMFYPAVRVASALGSASPESAQFIADKVAPIFLRQLEECGDLDENKEKKNILLGLLKDSISIASEKKCLNKLNQDVLTEIEKVFVSCLSDATHERIRTVGYLGLVEMCSQTNPETRQLIYTSFLEALRKGTSSELPIHTCCTRLIEYFPEEVITEFVTPLTKDQSVVSDLNCEEIFRILCTFIGPCRVNNEDVYKYLLNFVFQEQGIHLNDAEKQSRILLKLLTTLNELLKSGNPHVAKNFHNEHRLIDRLLESRAMFKGHVILQPLSTLLVNVISVQTDDEQKKLVEKYLPLLKVSEATDLYFIYGLLCRCSNAVPLEGIYEILVPDLIRASLAGGNNEQLQICDYLLCVLFNRNYQSVESWEQVLEGSIGQIKRSITESGQALRTLAWITKGLLMRGHPTADELVLIILNTLKDCELSSSASEAFECLVTDLTIPLQNVRMFYKQKFFDIVCKNLISSEIELDAVQLKALGRVLGELSPVVLRMHLSKVGNILFRNLEHRDPQTVQSTLKIFLRLLETDEKFCQDRIQFLISHFLQLSQFKGSMHIRILALNCLLATSKYPTYLLIPFKQDVLFSTIPALDDHKRLVRGAAVEARTRWFLIDSPIKEK